MSRADESKPPERTELRTPLNLHSDGATIDNYKLLECIGEGSFGQVWKAVKGNTEVALKILKTSMTSEETQRELKSLEVLQELKHQYLVQTYDFWSNGDQLFIEMELANGGSLKDRLRAWQSVGRKGIPEGELLKYFSEIAEALDYLHGQRPRRFLHRDVKPANILLVGGVAKLADFGLLRKVAGDNTGTKTQGGTPVFMAPESIKSDVFSPRTDLYSLAVTYAELRQGRLPFSGTTEYQVCNNILTSLPELGDEMGLAERQVLLKALDKDPNNRYASCGEFVAALKQAIPVKEAAAPGEATVMPANNGIDMGTSPRNVMRRSSTVAPRQALETHIVAELPPSTVMPPPPAPPSGGMKTPLFVAMALLILAGMGAGIWFAMNRGDEVFVPPNVRKLEIKTTPDGATVFIDDKEQKQTTNALFEVPTGWFQLRLRKEGHEDIVMQVVPDDSVVDQLLTPTSVVAKPRTVEIMSIPSGAAVFINKQLQLKPTNETYEIPKGSVSLRLTKEGYEPTETTIEPSQTQVNVTLKPIKVPPIARTMMEIKTKPPGATVYIDGKEQKKKTDAKFNVPDGPFELRLERDNHVVLRKTIAKDDKLVDVALEPIPRSYALLIGVNQPTKQLPDFLHAEADVAALGRTLTAGGFRMGDVHVLAQGYKDKNTLPTAAKIRQSLSALVNKRNPSDTLVLALVGHIVSFPGDVRSYFCSADSDLADKNTLLPLDEITKQLQQSPAQNKVLLLDGWRTDLHAAPELPNGTAIQRERAKDLSIPAGIVALTSCAADERGNQHPLLRQGLFFHSVIRVLQGAAGVPENRKITLDAVAEYVNHHVLEDAKRGWKLAQTPEILGEAALKSRIQFAHTETLAIINQATLALEGKKYDEALAVLDDPALKNTTNLDILTARALAHYHKGKDDPAHYEQAIQDCERAEGLDKRNAYANGYLAQIAAAKAKRPKVTAEQAEAEYKLALEYHDKDIQLDPQWAMAHNARGVTQAMRKEYALAIKDYNEAIRLDSKLKFAYENRGFAYMTQKDYQNALKDFNKAIEINPDSALTFARRGSVYRALGNQLWQALDDLNSAIQLDATNANYFYSRALIQVARKDFDKAIDDFSETLRIAKVADRETMYGRGYAYNEKGFKEKDADLYDKAIKDLTEAIKIDSRYTPALYVRGVAYQNKWLLKMDDEKLLDAAIADLTLAIKENPNHANAYFSRGRAYRAKKQKALGDADMKKAREIDPNVGKSPDQPGARLERRTPTWSVAAVPRMNGGNGVRSYVQTSALAHFCERNRDYQSSV